MIMETSDNVLSLSHNEARDFFLQHDNFCNIDLPKYFSFTSILTFLRNRNIDAIRTTNARNYSDVNYTLFCNKDGKYAWRPTQILNPVIYVKLVNLITEENNWNFLKKRFKKFQQNTQIQCTSIPVLQESEGKKGKAQQILTWWTAFEQKSIQLSLKYHYIFLTDITDCYGAMYAHSIAWAVHGKDIAKAQKRNHDLLGNAIDDFIEDMRFGQTNGISQGSVLMDFVAEIVLGYVDRLLSHQLKKEKIQEYKILRYRDDFRIFVNEPSVGEKILKKLTEILCDFGMRLNSSKTKSSSDIISASIKEDKRAWLSQSANFESLSFQKKLLLIHEHSIKFPNAGSLLKPLNSVLEEISGSTIDTDVMLSIIVDIAYRNPRTYPVCVAIMAKLLLDCDALKRQKYGEEILNKFNDLPNTEHLNIWLQRILYPLGINLQYSQKLTKIVQGENLLPWNFEWISDSGLKTKIMREKIIDTTELATIQSTIPREEIDIFVAKSEDYI